MANEVGVELLLPEEKKMRGIVLLVCLFVVFFFIFWCRTLIGVNP